VSEALSLKECRKCGSNKPADNFIKTKSGLKHWCFTCRSEHKKSEYKKHKESYLRRANDQYEKIKASPELLKQRREREKLWKKQNSKKVLANTRARQMKQKQRTPKWADLKKIREFYENCPQGYHVDHIIPINGKNISGLHVMSNLQYLPAEENLRKSNKYEAKAS
jgi:hypothetical protein